jgi:hypothetical protein
MIMLTFLLFACGSTDKETDTSTVDEPSSEASEEPSSEPSGEPEESSFPEEQELFDSQYENAVPAPLLEMDIGNTTVFAGYMGAMVPVMELQFAISFAGQENITCPTIEGTFPEDGLPEEDIVVTGNGCTNEEGVIYDGSFVYNALGITYDDYSTMQMPSEECPDVSSKSTYNGGSIMDMATARIEVLLHIQTEETGEDCSLSAGDIMINGNLSMEDEASGGSLVNGEMTFLFTESSASLWFDVITEDERLNSEICETEPISGTNTITNDSDTMVYTFDGETDCDEEPTQMLSINGAEATEVEGVGCAIVSIRTGLFASLFAFGLTLFRRRD